MTLPTNVDATYPDRDTGDATHQQHHDEIHGKVNRIPDDGSQVVTETTGSAAYARRLGSATSTTAQTGITTEVDLTGLSVSVTVAQTAWVRISCGLNVQTTNAGDQARLNIYRDAVNIQQVNHSPNSTGFEFVGGSVIESLAAGTYTFKLTGQRLSGTGAVDIESSANRPASILVEQIGT